MKKTKNICIIVFFSDQVERDVGLAVHEWEKEHGKDFLVCGMKYQQFIAQSWDDHNRHKEEEKQSRVYCICICVCISGIMLP